MKKITFLLVLVLSLSLLGCGNDTGGNNSNNVKPYTYANETERQVGEMALKHMETYEEYVTYSGKNLKITKIIQGACTGCWDVYVQFNVISARNPAIEEQISHTVIISNMVVEDVI